MDVTESPRIEELRRRVQKDPTSIAFAQLAEEYRRVGDYREAVNVCRSGLARHPTYLSARVTLARALTELEDFNDAQAELEEVLDLAPDNLAAIRAMAEIHQRRGEGGDTFRKTAAPPRQAPPPAPPIGDDGSALAEDSADTPRSATSDVGADVPASLPVLFESLPVSFEPAAGTPVLLKPPQPSEAMDTLGGLTLDLPPAPDFSAWRFDTNFSLPGDAARSLPDELARSLPDDRAGSWPNDPSSPLPDDPPSSLPGDRARAVTGELLAALSGEPLAALFGELPGSLFGEAPMWRPDSPPIPVSIEPPIAQDREAAPVYSPEPDPVVDELQRWLAAIVEDRSIRR